MKNPFPNISPGEIDTKIRSNVSTNSLTSPEALPSEQSQANSSNPKKKKAAGQDLINDLFNYSRSSCASTQDFAQILKFNLPAYFFPSNDTELQNLSQLQNGSLPNSNASTITNQNIKDPSTSAQPTPASTNSSFSLQGISAAQYAAQAAEKKTNKPLSPVGLSSNSSTASFPISTAQNSQSSLSSVTASFSSTLWHFFSGGKTSSNPNEMNNSAGQGPVLPVPSASQVWRKYVSNILGDSNPLEALDQFFGMQFKYGQLPLCQKWWESQNKTSKTMITDFLTKIWTKNIMGRTSFAYSCRFANTNIFLDLLALLFSKELPFCVVFQETFLKSLETPEENLTFSPKTSIHFLSKIQTMFFSGGNSASSVQASCDRGLAIERKIIIDFFTECFCNDAQFNFVHELCYFEKNPMLEMLLSTMKVFFALKKAGIYEKVMFFICYVEKENHKRGFVDFLEFSSLKEGGHKVQFMTLYEKYIASIRQNLQASLPRVFEKYNITPKEAEHAQIFGLLPKTLPFVLNFTGKDPILNVNSPQNQQNQPQISTVLTIDFELLFAVVHAFLCCSKTKNGSSPAQIALKHGNFIAFDWILTFCNSLHHWRLSDSYLQGGGNTFPSIPASSVLQNQSFISNPTQPTINLSNYNENEPSQAQKIEEIHKNNGTSVMDSPSLQSPGQKSQLSPSSAYSSSSSNQGSPAYALASQNSPGSGQSSPVVNKPEVVPQKEVNNKQDIKQNNNNLSNLQQETQKKFMKRWLPFNNNGSFFQQQTAPVLQQPVMPQPLSFIEFGIKSALTWSKSANKKNQTILHIASQIEFDEFDDQMMLGSINNAEDMKFVSFTLNLAEKLSLTGFPKLLRQKKQNLPKITSGNVRDTSELPVSEIKGSMCLKIIDFWRKHFPISAQKQLLLFGDSANNSLLHYVALGPDDSMFLFLKEFLAPGTILDLRAIYNSFDDLQGKISRARKIKEKEEFMGLSSSQNSQLSNDVNDLFTKKQIHYVPSYLEYLDLWKKVKIREFENLQKKAMKTPNSFNVVPVGDEYFDPNEEDLPDFTLPSGIKLTPTEIRKRKAKIALESRKKMKVFTRIFRFYTPKEVRKYLRTKDRAGNTPLHYAMFSNSFKCAIILLKYAFNHKNYKTLENIRHLDLKSKQKSKDVEEEIENPLNNAIGEEKNERFDENDGIFERKLITEEEDVLLFGNLDEICNKLLKNPTSDNLINNANFSNNYNDDSFSSDPEIQDFLEESNDIDFDNLTSNLLASENNLFNPSSTNPLDPSNMRSNYRNLDEVDPQDEDNDSQTEKICLFNIRNHKGHTPLHVAVSETRFDLLKKIFGDPKVVGMLWPALFQTNFGAKDGYKKTFMDLARECQREELINMMDEFEETLGQLEAVGGIRIPWEIRGPGAALFKEAGAGGGGEEENDAAAVMKEEDDEENNTMEVDEEED